MEFPVTPVELPGCQLNWEFLKQAAPVLGAPEFATTGSVTGNGGAILSPGFGGLFALDYTAPRDYNMIGHVSAYYRVDTTTAAWTWGQGMLSVSGGASLLSTGLNRAGYVLHNAGVFFVEAFMSVIIRIPAGTTAHIIASAKCQAAATHTWTATADNEISILAWKETNK